MKEQPNRTPIDELKQAYLDTPASSFAQTLVKRGGILLCTKCLVRVDRMPHQCKEWRSR